MPNHQALFVSKIHDVFNGTCLTRQLIVHSFLFVTPVTSTASTLVNSIDDPVCKAQAGTLSPPLITQCVYGSSTGTRNDSELTMDEKYNLMYPFTHGTLLISHPPTYLLCHTGNRNRCLSRSTSMEVLLCVPLDSSSCFFFSNANYHVFTHPSQFSHQWHHMGA